MYQDEQGFTQTAEPSESPGLSYGADAHGEFHIDGTPMRLVMFVAVGIIILAVMQRGGFRFHVVG